MFENKKNQNSSLTELPSRVEPAPTRRKEGVLEKLKRMMTRERSPEDPFSKYLDALDDIEKRGQEEVQEEAKRLYEVWADHYELLKQEFWGAWQLFYEIEQKVDGWFLVPPRVSEFGPVAIDTHGYTFGACIAKNHRRNAPYSEKSITVTFGMATYASGIGDERLIGRQSPLDDKLTGFEDCAGKTIMEQFEGSRRMIQSLQRHELQFRLHHRNIGQEVTSRKVDFLKSHSLETICQSLFVGLNKDVMPDLQLALESRKAPLLLEDGE